MVIKHYFKMICIDRVVKLEMRGTGFANFGTLFAEGMLEKEGLSLARPGASGAMEAPESRITLQASDAGRVLGIPEVLMEGRGLEICLNPPRGFGSLIGRLPYFDRQQAKLE
jgi:hypothetical protein